MITTPTVPNIKSIEINLFGENLGYEQINGFTCEYI